MRESLYAVTIAGVTMLGFGGPSVAQENAEQKLGTVQFATSCNETAQRRFDRAMRYQHSFWYTESKEIYEETLNADPECAIAYWGIALSLLSNPHSPVPAPNLPLGLAAIEKAKATGAKTLRERDYIDALAVMYVDYDNIPHQARVQSYLKAMEALAAKYPADARRFSMRSLSMSRRHPLTKRSPTSSKGRLSWSRSGSASLSTQASLTISFICT